MSNKDTLKTVSDAERQRRLLKAKDCVDKALKIYEVFPYAYYLRGRVFYQLNDYQHAYESYLHASSLNPGMAKYQNDLGTSLFSLGRFEEAAAVFQKAKDLNPLVADHPFNLGSACGALGEAFRQKNDMTNATAMFNKAIENFNLAIKLNPNYKSAYQFLGATYSNMGDSINAQIYFQKANQIKLPQ